MSSHGSWTQEQVERAGLKQRSVQFLCQDICGLTHTEHVQDDSRRMPCRPRVPLREDSCPAHQELLEIQRGPSCYSRNLMCLEIVTSLMLD